MAEESPVVESNTSPAPAQAQSSKLVLDELPPSPPRKWWKKVLLGLLVLLLLGIAGGAVTAYVLYEKYAEGLPEIPSAKDYRPPVLSEFWSTDRVLAGEFYDERRKVVPYERIPKKLVQAFIAAEDDRFFDHPGIDLMGTARAAFKTYVVRTRVQGGSTLTQQAAKAVLISAELEKVTEELVRAETKKRAEQKKIKPEDREAYETLMAHVSAELRAAAHKRATEKTIKRKIRELILAMRLEAAMTKEEILFLYLNNVYLGHHSYGVQSAAENYFRKDVRELTLGEMAILAGLPKAPSANSPWIRPQQAKSRRDYVLRRMHEEKMITEAERAAAEAEEVKAYPVEDVFKEFAPFFTEHVRRNIVNRYGNERMLTGGLQVFMTMHAERQIAAQVAMLDGLIRVDKRQGFVGPLLHLSTAKEKVEFEKKIAKKLGEEKLTEGRFYVGFVEKIEEKENLAVVNVGGQMGRLPIVGMRWARPPNPEKYYPSSLIDHVKQALKPGDVIVVKAVSRKTLEDSDEPALTKLIPKEGVLFTLEQEPQLQGALVSVDPSRGTVEAMIGGYDFDANEFNRAFQACRQPGSSFKPIVYSAAIEKLEWPVNKILVDAPIVTDSEDTNLRWKPENFGGDFKGDVLLRTALINSMNIPAIKTLQAVGVKEAAAWAKQLGITTTINEDLSMSLGGSCVHLWDLTNVYATFNQMGRKVQSRFVRKVEDRFGRTLEDHTWYGDPFARFEERVAGGYAALLNRPEQVMRPETGFLISHLMQEVVLFGTGAPAHKLGKPAAGKTGTTNDSFDTWFMGFTNDLVTGVWMGYDRYDHPLGRYETGGRASLPTWVDFMKRALGDRPQVRVAPTPDMKITWARIDPDTGKLAGPSTQQSVEAPFVVGTEPTEREQGASEVDPRQLMLQDY